MLLANNDAPLTMTPEQRARQQIDLLLQQCGWIVQDRSQINLAAGPGVAIREALLKGGEADSSELILNQLCDFGL
jgi:type I restriction enzyme R subunit